MNSPNILIIRTSAMGDIVMSSPLAEGLRRRYPEASICWLAEPQVRDLLVENPHLDRVIIWPKAEWKKLFRKGRILSLTREAFRFFRMLRDERFTLALDAQGLLRTRILAYLSGAQKRIGFRSREPGGFMMTELVEKGGNHRLMGSEYLHLLDTLGCVSEGILPLVRLTQRDRKEAANNLDSAGLTNGYAVCAPFTTRPQKHWVAEHWIELAAQLQKRLGLRPLWLGGPSDAKNAEQLAQGGGGVSLAGKTSLAVSAAIIAQANLVIGVDTGLVHLGTAFRIPTIALFGATCPYLETPSPHTAVLYHPYPCSPCRRTPTCDNRFPCMRDISVEEVLATAAGLLKGTSIT